MDDSNLLVNNKNDFLANLKGYISPFLVYLPILLLCSFLNNSISLNYHTEPINALSLPTWMVHSSSILEWLIAMNLIWEHSITANNPRWKGMTWAMSISNMSGLCACTYHFFYNTPNLYWIVALQAALTTIGNTAMAIAAYRIYDFEKQRTLASGTDVSSIVYQTLNAFATTNIKTDQVNPSSQVVNYAENSPLLVEKLSYLDKDFNFAINLVVKSFLFAIAVKFGELYLDFPFDSQPIYAYILVFVPALVTIINLVLKSKNDVNIFVKY
jgi:hypothetical protein